MSRSRKLDIYKDKRGWKTRLYHRRLRRIVKHRYHKLLDESYTIPQFKQLENDYNYSDYTLVNSYTDNISK